MQRKVHPLFPVALFLWAVALVAGFTRLQAYSSTPGRSEPTPLCWPASSRLRPDPQRATLVMLAHPHCPCTRSSLDELEQLLTRCQGMLAVHVLFSRPARLPENWEKTDLWYRTLRLPGVQVLSDEDGREARCFGASTSGHVFLYHADGRLLFQGGITSSRGHAGPSVGTTAIGSLLTTGTAEHTQAPVFGCPLYDSFSNGS